MKMATRMIFLLVICFAVVRSIFLGNSCSLTLYVVLLQEKKLLDLPKLLDICAIYGHENEDLTSFLVSKHRWYACGLYFCGHLLNLLYSSLKEIPK